MGWSLKAYRLSCPAKGFIFWIGVTSQYLKTIRLHTHTHSVFLASLKNTSNLTARVPVSQELKGPVIFQQEGESGSSVPTTP